MCFTLILWNETTMLRLKRPPDTFDVVRMNIAHDPLLGAVVDRLVPRVLVSDAHVASEVVGVDGLGRVAHVAVDEVVQRGLPHVRDALDPDLPAALDSSGDPVLVLAPVLTAPLAADHGLVDLDDAYERGGRRAGRFPSPHGCAGCNRTSLERRKQ